MQHFELVPPPSLRRMRPDVPIPPSRRELEPQEPKFQRDSLQRSFAEVAPKTIAAKMIDGGTRFALDFVPGKMRPAFGYLVHDLMLPTDREFDSRERRQGGRFCMLPMPNGTGVGCRVKVSGVRRHMLTFYVQDMVWFRVNVEQGECHLQLKAKQLWAQGYANTATFWLNKIAWMLCGQEFGELSKAYSFLSGMPGSGWRMTGLELCSDFLGINWFRSDVENFIGIRTRGDRSTLKVRAIGEAPDATVETLDIGSRDSNISVCIYDKDEQINSAKDGDGSAYAATHKANGWDGEARRTRVEFRFSKRGLLFRCPETGEILDFHDPATCANPEALSRLWFHTSTQKRLILPSSATRLRRCKSDPRWRYVIELADVDEAAVTSLRQHRVVQKDAWQAKVDHALRDHMRAGRRLSVLLNLECYRSQVISRFVEDFVRDHEDVGDDMDGYRQRYRGSIFPFVGKEIRKLGRQTWTEWLVRPVTPEDMIPHGQLSFDLESLEDPELQPPIN